MNEFAQTILLFLSSIFNIQTTPDFLNDWEIIKSWEKTNQNMFVFVAENKSLFKICEKNPKFYIEFPSIIHSHTSVSLNNVVIANLSSPDLKHIRGFYGSLTIPCSQIIQSKKEEHQKKVLTWKVISYTKYFSRFSYFPRTIKYFPKSNLFNESLNIMASGILLILCIFNLIVFVKKIEHETLMALFLSNFFTSIYFIFNVAEFMGISTNMLFAHKIADIGLWIGFLFFFRLLFLEKLILKWMLKFYEVILFFSIIIIFFAQHGDIIQLGTTVPFLPTLMIISYPAFLLLRQKIKHSRKDYLQMISLWSFILSCCNDIFLVMGVIESVPVFSIGIVGSYTFILLSINERITNTYIERDRFKELSKQLMEQNETLEHTQDKLIKSEKMAALGRATARIAHELNTPISNTRASAENIETITQDFLEEIKQSNIEELETITKSYQKDSNTLLRILTSSVNKSAELVRNFKMISIDQEKEEKREFKLLDYINESIFSMQSILEKKNLDVELKGDNPLIYKDPSIFHQITQNMLINAIQYAYKEKNGKIDIKIEEKNEEIILIYQDYGAGIPNENISKVFDPFFTTGGGKGGTGLGLNIVYKNVTSYLKGDISCESEINKGTKFIVTFLKETKE